MLSSSDPSTIDTQVEPSAPKDSLPSNETSAGSSIHVEAAILESLDPDHHYQETILMRISTPDE